MRLRIPVPRFAVWSFLGLALVAGVSVHAWWDETHPRQPGFFDVALPEFYDGLPLDHYTVQTREVRTNDILGQLLGEFGIPSSRHHALIQACSASFNLKALREGHRFHVFHHPDDCRPEWLIYEPGPYRSFRIRLNGETSEVEKIERPVNVVLQKKAGEIRSSLWNAMKDADLPIPLIIGMETALECAVDFHHLQKGDHFRIMYEEDHLNGERIGLGKIRAVSFTQGDSSVYAIYYEKDTIKGFYDLQGRPMRSMFLKAPVRFSRISSYYSPSRLHPILRIRRPHLGTDYAAPYGTEILAVADGTVIEASRKGGNGIYVKIRHNSTYETQYLHMQRHAKGIRPGVRVRQGQVIGFVGSTGLATGPHVCYRFWKNGKQVNPLRERLPEAKPMAEARLPEYFAFRDRVLAELNAIPRVQESVRPAPGSTAPLVQP